MAHKFFHYQKLSSTNAEAKRLLKDGKIRENSFVLSDYQTDGKGRSGNTWESEAGKNLLMSWIAFPAFLSASLQFQLSKAVSLSIINLFKDYSLEAEIKWPNDIVCNERKVAGILIENTIMGSSIKHSITGIGINVNQKEFPGYRYRADSMQNLLGRVLDISKLAIHLADHLEESYELLSQNENAPDDYYLRHLFMRNMPAKFLQDEKQFVGVIKGINELGELLVERDKIIHAYGFHDISMLY